MTFSTDQRVAVAALLGAAALGCVPGAHAQGSVTIYGVVDTGIERVSNVGPDRRSVTRMPSLTGSRPSRLGFRGTEDLGNGQKALFVLEQGMAVDQGTLNQGGRLFGRQAFVGLSGRWGQLSFGRQYSRIYIEQIGDTMGPNIYAAGDLDGYLANARVDNAIAYQGTFGGWTVGATYSFGRDAVLPAAAGGCAGESATDSTACRDVSASVRYATPQWGVALSSERMHGGAGTGSPLPLSAQTDTRTVLSGFYKIVESRLGWGVVRRNNEGSLTPKSTLWYVGGTHPIGPVELDLQYASYHLRDSPNDAALIAGRAMYHFSKRTATYFTMGKVFNKGAATFTIDGGVTAGSAPLPGVDQTGVMIGVRHLF